MEIINLVQELERLKRTSADVVTPTKLINAVEDGGTVKLDLKSWGKMPLTRHAENQLTEKTGVPIKYFREMQEAGMADLAAENVNRWLHRADDNRLVRMADNHIRAVLSDRYRALDNYDLAIRVMDRAKEHNAVIIDSQLTEERMYVKALAPQAREYLEFTPEEKKAHTWHKVGNDSIIPGIMVSNSEVGSGAFRVEPFTFREVCSNTAIGTDSLFKVHLGGRLEIGQLIYKDDTLRSIDTALWNQVSDIIDGTFNPTIFKKIIDQLRNAATIPVQPKEVLDATAKDLSLSEDKKLDLLRYFSKEGDTAFGLVNGITRLAQDYDNYDQRVEVERYAGKKLETLVTAR
jgi:hypothetical protein